MQAAGAGLRHGLHPAMAGGDGQNAERLSAEQPFMQLGGLAGR